MDAYDRCINLGEKILPIFLPSLVEAENFSDHPRTAQQWSCVIEPNCSTSVALKSFQLVIHGSLTNCYPTESCVHVCHNTPYFR